MSLTSKKFPKEIVEKVAEDIRNIAAELMTSEPFYGFVLSKLGIYATDKVPLAATDGVRIYINPVNWFRIEPASRVAVIVHEIEHVIRMHPLRGKKYVEVNVRRGIPAKMAWIAIALATDAIINEEMPRKYAKYLPGEPVTRQKISEEFKILATKQESAEEIADKILNVANKQITISCDIVLSGIGQGNQQQSQGNEKNSAGSSESNRESSRTKPGGRQQVQCRCQGNRSDEQGGGQGQGRQRQSEGQSNGGNNNQNQQREFGGGQGLQQQFDPQQSQGEQGQQGGKQSAQGSTSHQGHQMTPNGDSGEAGDVANPSGEVLVDGEIQKIQGQRVFEGEAEKEFNPSDEEQYKQFIREIMVQAKTAGLLPGHLEKQLEALIKAKINWRRVFRNQLQAIFSNELKLTWSRLNKKNEDLPGRREIGLYERAFILLDVSGSMDDKEVEQAIAEANDILKKVAKKVVIVQWDAKVQDIKVFNTTIKKFERRGYGGTVIRPALEKILYDPKWRVRKTDVVVAMTDAEISDIEKVRGLMEKIARRVDKAVMAVTYKKNYEKLKPKYAGWHIIALPVDKIYKQI